MECVYIDGDLVPCNDLVTVCKDPLIEFAKDFVSDPPNCKLWEGPCATESEIWRNGNVRIGSGLSFTDYKLGVLGGITTEMLQICKAEWCDYVFSDTFHLTPLTEVAHHIEAKGYLPECTPASAIVNEGGFQLDIEAVSQQKKIEEIFLHLINAQSRLDKFDKKTNYLRFESLEKASPGLEEYLSTEYPNEQRKSEGSSAFQIQCLRIKSAPDGTAGIIPTHDSGPYDISWSGSSTGGGSLNDVTCNGLIKIYNLSSGHYSVTVTNASGMTATCTFYMPSGGTPVNCSALSNPLCKSAIIDMLEEEAFSTPPDCEQWEGDPCSVEEEIYRLGNVEIGTNVGRAGYSLAVKGGIVTDKFRVELCESQGWCDYVFDESYSLISLPKVDSFIKTHKHLPGSVSQAEITANGGFEMRSVKLDHQKKIEEVYLHLIALNKMKDELEQRIRLLGDQN